MNRTNFLGVLLTVGLLATSPGSLADDPKRSIEPDVVYGHKDGLALTMDVYPPKEKANGAAILFMVSGGWFSRWAPPENLRPLLNPYLEKGYRVMAVRHGSSPRYTIEEAVNDVRRAVRFVRQNAARFEIDAERLGVLGMSAGGHLSLMLATTGADGDPGAKEELQRVSSRVAAVAALVPPTDLRVMVWGAPESLPAYKNFPALELDLAKAPGVSPALHVTADDAPALVIMGEKDELVPPVHGEWIAAAYKEAKVSHKLIIVPGAGHGLDGEKNRTRVQTAVVSWFDAHLGRGTKDGAAE